MDAVVFVDPFEQAAAAVQKERQSAKQAEENGKRGERVNARPALTHRSDEVAQGPATAAVVKPKAYSSGVGKYIQPQVRSALKRSADEEASGSRQQPAAIEAPFAKRKPTGSKPTFSDFSAW